MTIDDQKAAGLLLASRIEASPTTVWRMQREDGTYSLEWTHQTSINPAREAQLYFESLPSPASTAGYTIEAVDVLTVDETARNEAAAMIRLLVDQLSPMGSEAWSELHKLRANRKGPKGFESWQAAATHERALRVQAEKALAALTTTQNTADLPELPPLPPAIVDHPELGELFDRLQVHTYAVGYRALTPLKEAPEPNEAMRLALLRLLASSPEIAQASYEDLLESINDVTADPLIREQAAAILQARLAFSLVPNMWIAISERLPEREIGKDVSRGVLIGGPSGVDIWHVSYEHQHKNFDYGGPKIPRFDNTDATHWMDLPPGPWSCLPNFTKIETQPGLPTTGASRNA